MTFWPHFHIIAIFYRPYQPKQPWNKDLKPFHLLHFSDFWGSRDPIETNFWAVMAFNWEHQQGSVALESFWAVQYYQNMFLDDIIWCNIGLDSYF